MKQSDWGDWRWQYSHSCRSLPNLQQLIELPDEALDAAQPVADRYPLCVTPYYLSLAARPSASDPIIRQILPDPKELKDSDKNDPDPLGEQYDSPLPGFIHRYPDRAVYCVTSDCAVHCRHCMRKRFWGAEGEVSPRYTPEKFDAVCAYIRAHTELREILLSGGDPLLLPDEQVAHILASLQAIPTIDFVRIGTRLPVVMPQRFTRDFCELLGAYPPVWLATHFNHPQELTPAATLACENLLRAGIPVVNQTVLMKGINDDPATLEALFRGLLRMRVKPYYLFHGDPVAGTEHFRTGLPRGLEIMNALSGRISGLAEPAFAIDLPKGGGKIRLLPQRFCAYSRAGHPLFQRFSGDLQTYR